MAVMAGVMFYVGGMDRIATAVCVIGVMLDGFDGWCARRFEQTTALGAYLDPMADKLMMAVIYAVIAVKTGNIEVWGLFILLLIRDVTVTTKRSISFVRRRRCVAASGMGKIKMAVQSVGGLAVLGYMVWFPSDRRIPTAPVVFLFGVVALLSYISAWKYGAFSPSKIVVPLRNRNEGKVRIGFSDNKGACRRPGTGPL
jgi:phosphatidylglycerophosphate synthase